MEIQTVKLQDDGWLINGAISVPNDPANRHYEVVQDWIAAGNTPEPEFTQADLDAQAEAALAEAANAVKLAGVEFEGVMCSATAEDMWGLSAIKDWITSGQSANFKFENGNTLLITPLNLASFEAVWIPFRASFFSDI